MHGRSLTRRRFIGAAAASFAGALALPLTRSLADDPSTMPYEPEATPASPPAGTANGVSKSLGHRVVVPGLSHDIAPSPPPPDDRYVVPVVFSHGDPSGDAVYITIDDCYWGAMVEQALTTADRYGARLTFFPVGQDVDRMPSLWRTVDSAGHRIENHTYDHRSLLRQSVSEIKDTIARQRWAIEGALGRPYTQHFVRPPGGDGLFPADPRLPPLGAELQLKFAGWSGDSNGWRYHPRTDAAAIDAVAANALHGFGPGSIVLFHSLPVDMAALDVVLRAARDRGLRCITMPAGLR